MACLFHLALLHVATLLAFCGSLAVPVAWALNKVFRPIQRKPFIRKD